jgi:putative SOS response-associated peptidase YedK
MCGRFYVSEAELDDFAALIEGIEKDLLKPRPNRGGTGDVVPGDYSPVLVADPESRVQAAVGGLPALTVPYAVRVFSWGFPAPQGKSRIINARAETVMQKPMFRLPFVAHRCLVPALGFYEWSDAAAFSEEVSPTRGNAFEPDVMQMSMDGFDPRANAMWGSGGFGSPAGISLPDSSAGISLPDSPTGISLPDSPAGISLPESPSGISLPGSPSGKHGKTPRIRHRYTRADSRMLVMAGLYWTFRLSSMENLTAFTILTVDANADVSPIHDRMPLILEEQDLRTWLTVGISDAVAALLVPSVQGTLRREVSAAG